MRETRYYQVAEHAFSVSGESEFFSLMTNYEPFEVKPGNRSVFATKLDIMQPVPAVPPAFTEELRQEDEGQDIICGRTDAGEVVFEFRWWKETAGWLVCTDRYLMVLFALATADQHMVLFHAAVVSHQGKGYMFLGPSGTGKSTHARLWLKYIEGTELVNDDNPVVRISDEGHIKVYGSPWSGKTPCYRNVNYPIGAIVLLSQAPYNKIQRMGGIHAYASLMESISGKRWDSRIADGLHQTQNSLVMSVPMWHLECLPDEEAATMCFAQISN